MTSYAPKDPSGYSRLTGTVAGALDDLAAQLKGTAGLVDGWTAGGFIVATGSDSRSLTASGATVDGSGSISTQGSDITTAGGDVVTGPGLVDGRDVSVDGTKLDTLHTLVNTTGIQTVVLTYGAAASSSAALAPLQPHSNGGSNTWARGYRMPRAGRVVHVALQANVTTAGGSPQLSALVYKTPEGTGTSSGFIVASTGVAVATGTNKYVATSPSSGNTFAAGDWISVDRLRSGGFAMTTEDHVASVHVVFDGVST